MNEKWYQQLTIFTFKWWVNPSLFKTMIHICTDQPVWSYFSDIFKWILYTIKWPHSILHSCKTPILYVIYLPWFTYWFQVIDLTISTYTVMHKNEIYWTPKETLQSSLLYYFIKCDNMAFSHLVKVVPDVLEDKCQMWTRCSDAKTY